MTAGEDNVLHIVAGPRNDSRCARCRQRIEWAVKAGTPAKYVPINPRPLVLSSYRNEGGVVILRISRNALHFLTCRQSSRVPA